MGRNKASSRKTLVWNILLAIAVLLMPVSAFPEINYRFERMWPTLKQPWYFFEVSDLAADSKGNIYITDFFNHQVKKFSQDGSFITTWGTEGKRKGQFIYPEGIAVDNEDNVYVVDKGTGHKDPGSGNAVSTNRDLAVVLRKIRTLPRRGIPATSRVILVVHTPANQPGCAGGNPCY